MKDSKKPYALRLLTKPLSEPVSPADVRLHTHISHTEEDSLLRKWISTARSEVEKVQKRAYITQTWQITFDKWPCFPFILPRAPLQSVTSFRYYDEDNVEYTWDASNYFVDTISEPGRIALNNDYETPSETLRGINSVIVEYVSGYGDSPGDIPENVIDAIMLYCAWRYENRTAEDKFPRAFYSILDNRRIFETR